MQRLRANSFLAGTRLARHIGIAPFDAYSLRKLQISQWNKKWCKKLGSTTELMNAADPNDKYFWPEAGDRMFPRGEQIFWIINVSFEGQFTKRLLQATSLHQLYMEMEGLNYRMSHEDDWWPQKSYDIYLEGELLQNPELKSSRFGSDIDEDDKLFDFPEWRQLALCSFYRPGDEINVQLVAKSDCQPGASEGKAHPIKASNDSDQHSRCFQCFQTVSKIMSCRGDQHALII